MGSAKGLLVIDGRPLLARLLDVCAAAGFKPVLVGRRAEYANYTQWPVVPDSPAGIGPAGGLGALLDFASEPVIAVACDMPFVTGDLLARLRDEAPAAAALAPQREGRWEPLCARYDAARVAPLLRARVARNQLGLQGLLQEAGAQTLALRADEERALVDWDTPADVTAC